MVERGNLIRIKDNLGSVLQQLGFPNWFEMSEHYTGEYFIVHSIWADSDGQKYATIDLCVEIPVQCCEVMA